MSDFDLSKVNNLYQFMGDGSFNIVDKVKKFLMYNIIQQQDKNKYIIVDL